MQFSRKRALSPADKAEYALTVNYYQSHCGPVLPEIEERAKAYASESSEDIWAGFDAMLQHRGLVIGSPMPGAATWARFGSSPLYRVYHTAWQRTRLAGRVSAASSRKNRAPKPLTMG